VPSRGPPMVEFAEPIAVDLGEERGAKSVSNRTAGLYYISSSTFTNSLMWSQVA